MTVSPCPADISAARNQLALSRYEFANRIGVHERTVKRWEEGTCPIPASVGLAIRYLLMIAERKRQKYP